MTISVTIESTGEVIEHTVVTSEDLVKAFQDVTDHLDAYRKLKAMLMETSINILKQQINKKG